MNTKKNLRIFGTCGAIGFLALAGSARGTTLNYDFEGSSDSWTNTVTNPNPSAANNSMGNGWSSFAPWQNNAGDGNAPITTNGTGASGTWQMAPNVSTFSNPCCPQDELSNTVILSSPVVTLYAGASITFALDGGDGGGGVAGNISSYNADNSTDPTSSSGTGTSTGGFEGLALRIVGTGNYVLSQSHQPELPNNQGSDNYQQFTFTAAQLASKGVLNGTQVQLDLIDSFHGGWGWVALDNVSITVPEPVSASILGLGAVGVLSTRRRRVARI